MNRAKAADQRPARARVKQQDAMATVTSTSLSPQDDGRAYATGALGEFRAFWRQFFVRAFDPYRPELHYMRGPGPACRAKQRALSPAVQSMVVEIRAARALKSSASR
jgi:hypothetical protein